MSRFFDQAQDASTTHSRCRDDWGESSRPFRVLTITNNKGGIGKTTLAANLAVYIRALREDLPILVIGLDDQNTLDRFFSLDFADNPGQIGRSPTKQILGRLVKNGCDRLIG